MIYCRQCGKEAREGETFCRHCGAKLVPAQTALSGPLSPTNRSEDDLALFIGKNSDAYLAKFRNFTDNGEDSFGVTWHWPAFFVPVFWMLYRKLYGWAVLALFLGLLPYIGIISHVVFGMTANYLYFQSAKKKLGALKALPASETQRAADLARTGGVNNAAVVIAVLLISIAVTGILAAIAIPQFAAYRQRAFDMKAKQEVQDACSRCIAIFSAHPEKAAIMPDDLLNTGFSPSPDIDLMLLDGKRETFGLSAGHVQSKKVYITDQECRLREELRDPGLTQEPSKL
jgi:hypothetical protein